MPAAHGQLASLNEKPWIGYYAAYSGKKFQIGLSSQGKIVLSILNERGGAITHQLEIDIQAGIEETVAEGKAVMRQVKVETLEGKEPATDKLEKVRVKGMVTGDAAFELNIEQNRGIILIGGRMTDAGTLTKNPAAFGIRVRIPSLYRNEKLGDKRAEKAFEKKLRDDSLELKWTDGKRVKHTLGQAVVADSKEVNGPGIGAVEFDASAYRGKKLVFTASPNSSMTLWNSREQPLHQGFSINWKADAARDPEGKARLAIEVK